MWQLYQFPLCPFSRKVRLLLAEKGVGYEPVRKSPWLRRDEFLDMNPAGQTPVMVDTERATAPLINSMAICEYFEETVDKAAMINGTAANRAEIRRLVAWFDTQFYRDITAPLLNERMLKRVVHRTAPDAAVLREAMKAAVGHLDYIDYPARSPHLAGRRDDEPRRSGGRGADFGRRLSRRDRLEEPRTGQALVRRHEEPPELPPAAGRADGGHQPAGRLREAGPVADPRPR